MHRLHAFAGALGIKVIERSPGPGRAGCYLHSRRLVMVSPGLRSVDARYTLAHELGHAVSGDESTGDALYDLRQEVRADRFAARMLIDSGEVERLERMYGPNWGAIAHDLGVPEHLLAVWRDLHQRVSA